MASRSKDNKKEIKSKSTDKKDKKTNPRKKTNTKKEKKLFFSKKEFVFNFISLVVIICIGIYFGGRSFYYYGEQNSSKKQVEQTLNGVLLSNNKIVKEGDGFHRDNDGYFFKGNVESNYVMAFNRLFRVLRVSDDGFVKLVSEDNVASFMYGEDTKYQNSNIRKWLTKTDNEYSGIYYDTIPNIKDFVIKTKYTEDVLGKKVITGKHEYSDYVTSLSLQDYVNSGSSNGFLNNKKLYYLNGTNKDNEVLFVDEDGSILGADSLDGYGIRSVITLKNNLTISSGDGSLNNPYVINQKNKVNYIDSYVKLGNDIWKVYNNTNNVLKMYLNGYLNVGGVELKRNYSKSGSKFDITNKNNIGYYLNTTYLKSLPYSNYLIDNNFYTGELSTDTGYEYKNIYTDRVTCRVGLLNIFDYVSNNSFNDYFHMNTTSGVGSIQYSTNSNGLLEEADVTDLKHVVPVVSINSASIKSGDGTLNNPYVLE